ncbi:hypothetical protein [Nocardia cyriacigeorgica]|uniref:hypothetical protein n=1 Tax=Nocardia cyriacigeorgica TaxID=135487 RepID=UPI0024555519|nr:hypothetical protein [Nocardia cyriacigeorgica]
MIATVGGNVLLHDSAAAGDCVVIGWLSGGFTDYLTAFRVDPRAVVIAYLPLRCAPVRSTVTDSRRYLCAVPKGEQRRS